MAPTWSMAMNAMIRPRVASMAPRRAAAGAASDFAGRVIAFQDRASRREAAAAAAAAVGMGGEAIRAGALHRLQAPIDGAGVFPLLPIGRALVEAAEGHLGAEEAAAA